MYIYIYICQRGLYLIDTDLILSVQVRLKTHPWSAGRFSLPEADGHERVRLQRTSRWLSYT